ncbi:angiopoietin-2b [Brienomyrus brachyistius]|uniref:angiopoietin-2b n=1 Tax=Brienomyrus brachyistius TaxID=42636 RepID=UPI0020B3AB19|nr:angiopoietin-2b [Brienomyrus brachyistius]
MQRFLAAGSLLVALLSSAACERRHHHVQHGPCSYTFLLPEMGHCGPASEFQVTNSLQRDSAPLPGGATPTEQDKKLTSLENAMENNTQWLLKLENYIQENVRSEMEELQRNTVHTQTAAMLEIGTNLLSQSAEQTRKLTDVETQMMNQTSRLEMQLFEYSLSTHKLERQILQQTQQISRLNDKNSLLERRLAAMEGGHTLQLQALLEEKQKLQELLARQAKLVAMLEVDLGGSIRSDTSLHHQQEALTGALQKLLTKVQHCNGSTLQGEISTRAKEEAPSFRDCAEIYKSGITENGVYRLHVANSTQTFKVFCDMKTRGGGWTVLQWRQDGSVDFHRNWADYKTGFGEPSGEYWLGNDFIHWLTTGQHYVLQVQVTDREGNEAYSQYDHFYIDGEEHNYSLHSRGFGGTAGRSSSLAPSGTPFSTKDRDNDRCSCKCAQMASGGWWFDACGPSNLNGVYYGGKSNVLRFNGIKWYYWKGLHLMARATAMMVRPARF